MWALRHISCKNGKNRATNSIAIYLGMFFLQEMPVDDILQTTKVMNIKCDRSFVNWTFQDYISQMTIQTEDFF